MVIARELDKPGYGAVPWVEQDLNRRLDLLDGHLQQATRELLEVEQAEAAVRFQADVLTRALVAIVSHRELAGPGHRCDDGCTRELADDALVALMTAGVLSERPPEHTTEVPDEPV